MPHNELDLGPFAIHIRPIFHGVHSNEVSPQELWAHYVAWKLEQGV